MKKKKKFLPVIVFLILITVGVLIILYPTISSRWNEMHASRAVDDYEHALSGVDEETIRSELEKAEEYNQKLTGVSGFHTLSESEKEEYESLLNEEQDGMMGYIVIPELNIRMPIYHGTEENVLQNSAGHVEWSSLPVGGEGTHCVIAGHRALPNARLFTDLDSMQNGDIFELHVLNETLYYEVEKISTVLPEDVDELQIEEGRDLCTLVTCTPYGINTHRLLVTGHRIDMPKAESTETENYEVQSSRFPYFRLILLAIAAIFAVIIIKVIYSRRKNRRT